VSAAPAEVPGSGEVTATVIVKASADRVYAAFTAWDRQGEWIPFTKVSLVSGDGGVGSNLLAVTAVGPAVVRDEMRVTRLDPPVRSTGSCTTGRLPARAGRTALYPHGGWPYPGRLARVVPAPGGRAGRWAWPVLWPGSKASLTAALRRFARLVEAGSLP